MKTAGGKAIIRDERERYLRAARVPVDLHPQRASAWHIDQVPVGVDDFPRVGFTTLTMLWRWSERARDPGDPFAHEGFPCKYREVVMEDSRSELSTHLPVWLAAHGQVLVTGLGLGCVVRGLLANPRVEHVDVVEIDADILRVVGAEFEHDPRVTLWHGDATQFPWPPSKRWDVAWHDIWTPNNEGLHPLHLKMMFRLESHARAQGAWKMPRLVKRLIGRRFAGLIR